LPKPTVLHFVETGVPGGAERVILDLCRAQAAAGLRPLVAHFDHPYFLERCAALGIDSFALPKRALFKRSITLPLFAVEFAARLRRQNVQLLHSHLFGPIIGGSAAACFARTPHVGTLHDVHMIEEDPSRIWQLQAAALLGTRLVTVSADMLNFYAKRLLWGSRSLSHIPNGVDAVTDAHMTSITREALSIPPGSIVAIVVGRLVRLKRIPDVLYALRDISVESPITLLIAGDGPERSELMALADQLHISEKVRFLGARNDVAALLRCSDIFVQCSDTEGLSMSIIEALHAGLPCIVTRVGGNAELVLHEHNGVTYDPGDVSALSHWVSLLAADARARALMGERSRQLAQRDYTMRVCADRYMQLYEKSGLVF
jgi:L-malate glycosyltransferase